jgi:hypothetical protein
MDAYLIFGDPRRAESRVVYSARVPAAAWTVHGALGRVVLGGQTIEGAVLAAPDSPGLPGSLLVSESTPDAHTQRWLAGAGWSPTVGEPPYAQRVPFSVEATVAVRVDDRVRAWTRVIWLDHYLIGTQRTVIAVGQDPDVPVRCLAMAPVAGERPRALLLLEPGARLPEFDAHGWLPLPPVGVTPRWDALIRVADAVEARVQYLLDTPLCVAVTVHDAARLEPADFLTVLDPDVALETARALTGEQRDWLVPVAVRDRMAAPDQASSPPAVSSLIARLSGE